MAEDTVAQFTTQNPPPPPPGFTRDEGGFTTQSPPPPPPGFVREPSDFEVDAPGQFESQTQVPPDIQRQPLPKPEGPIIPSDVPTRDTIEELGEQFRETQRLLRERIRIRRENKKKAARELRLKLGDQPFDESGSLSGDFESLALRADFARSDKFREMQLKFLEAMPAGTIRTVKLSGGENVLIFRESDDDPWKPVDPKSMETLTTLADILPVVFNESTFLAGLMAAGTQGSSAVARVLLPALGDAIGVLAQAGVEEARGFETTPRGEVATQAGVSLALGTLINRLVSFRKKLQAEHPEITDAETAAEFARREGVEGPVIGQTARNPIVRAAFQQAAGTVQSAQDLISRQKSTLLAALRRRSDEADFLSDDDLAGIGAKRLSELRQSIEAHIKGIPRKIDFAESLNEIVGKFWERGRQNIGRLYDAANQVSDGVTFNIKDAQELGQVILRGTVGRGQPQTRTLPDGRTITVREKIRTGQPVDSEFAAALEDLRRLDPDVRPFISRGQEDSAFEIVKDLRTRFFLISLPEFGARRSQMQNNALSIHKALTRSMENPAGGSPQFAKLHKEAAKANADFERLTEMGFLKSILREIDNPASDVATSAASNLARPGAPQRLRTINRIATDKEWKTFQDGYISSLLADPASISRKFDAFETAGELSSLRLLISPIHEAELRNFGRQFNRIASSPIQKQLDSFGDSAEKALAILKKSTRSDLADAVKKAGGRESEFAQSLVGATYLDVLQSPGVVQILPETGDKILNVRAALKRFAEIEEEGKINSFMKAAEIENFKNFSFITSLFSGAMDVGGALRRGAITGAVREFPMFVRMARGAHRVLSDKFTARALSLPAGRRLLTSKAIEGAKPGTLRAVRMATILMSVVAQDLQRKSEREKP